jgi:hypothetical protein
MVFNNNSVGWPNGKALDYESRDCRFDPCVDQLWYSNVTTCVTNIMSFFSLRSAGPMARRLTTNQEIAGSIPASINERR